MTVNILNSKKISEMIKNREFKLIIDLRNEDILLYCANGHQSITVGKVLLLNGFNNVYSLDNGIKYYKYELYK